MEKSKEITNNMAENLTIKWDETRFGLILSNKMNRINKVIILNPKEMKELIDFANKILESDQNVRTV